MEAKISWNLINYTVYDGDRVNVYAVLKPEGGVTGIYAKRELNRTTFECSGVQEVTAKFRFYNKTGEDCAVRIEVHENDVVIPEVLDIFETNFPYYWVRSDDHLVEIYAHCSDISNDEYYLKGYVRVTPRESGILTFKPYIWISRVIHKERQVPLGVTDNLTISKPEYNLQDFEITTGSPFNWSMSLNVWTSLVEFRQVSVLNESGHPIIDFVYHPLVPVVSDIVFFNASQSYDPDGQIVNYSWDFGDGYTATTTQPTVQYTYSQPGTYTVTLAVTDDSGLISSVSKQIVVSQGETVLDSVDDSIEMTVSKYNPSFNWTTNPKQSRRGSGSNQCSSAVLFHFRPSREAGNR